MNQSINPMKPIAWLKFYEYFLETPTVFLGEFYIHKNKQGMGHGKKLLLEYENYWRCRSFTKIILNVDLKNWSGLRFWLNLNIISPF